jgi:hypothetical protein
MMAIKLFLLSAFRNAVKYLDEGGWFSFSAEHLFTGIVVIMGIGVIAVGAVLARAKRKRGEPW